MMYNGSTPDLAPLRESPDELYQQFIEVLEKFTQTQHQQLKQKQQNIRDGQINSNGDEDDDNNELIYELGNEFECLTNAHLQVLINLASQRSLTEDDARICKKLEVMLKEERNSWRLIKALFKGQMFEQPSQDVSRNGSDRMDDSSGNELAGLDTIQSFPFANNVRNNSRFANECTTTNNLISHPGLSEDQIIGNFYLMSSETRRMQLVTDWLEANDGSDIDYKDEEDKVEFYSEGPTAWENTLHAMRSKYFDTTMPSMLDVTVDPHAGIELCSAMDPDAPIRTKKSLAHSDKEVEIRLFKHLFRFLRAGKLDEGQALAQKVGYHWLSASLDGWLPHSDENLDDELLGTAIIRQPSDLKPVTGNKKRDVWKQTCFKTARMHGLNNHEKAILGVLGGNLKSVLPVCHNWSDQLWARLKCSIDVKTEKALRDPSIRPKENRNSLIEYPQEFYENYQDLPNIFQSIKDLKIVSSFKEATIHQTIQKYLILNDIDGLLNQLSDWCKQLDYDNNLVENNEAISPQFLRFFAHVVLFLRELELIGTEDVRATNVIESYINLLTQHKSIESVAHYTTYLPRDNQIVSYAKLLATIENREERKHCLKIANDSKLDVDEITQTVVELIRDSPAPVGGCGSDASMLGNDHHGYQHSHMMAGNTSLSSEMERTRTTANDKRKIDSLDYLLYLDSKNYIAILHHSNMLLRIFALQRKLDALKETFLKLPADLCECVEKQWTLHTNKAITTSLKNNMRELDCFRVLLEVQEELSQWSEWHRKKPEEPRKPANLSKFCDNVNYEQRLKQYQQDLNIWKELREVRTNNLTGKIGELFYFPGGWMRDEAWDEGASGRATTGGGGQSPCPLISTSTSVIVDSGQQAVVVAGAGCAARSDGDSQAERRSQLDKLRKIFIPHMTTIHFNVLQLTNRYEDCLKVSHLLVQEDLQLSRDFSKAQIRDFLDKISEVTKIIVRMSLVAAGGGPEC